MAIQGDYLNEVHEYIRGMYYLALPVRGKKDLEASMVLDLFYRDMAQHLDIGSSKKDLLQAYLYWVYQ